MEFFKKIESAVRETPIEETPENDDFFDITSQENPLYEDKSEEDLDELYSLDENEEISAPREDRVESEYVKIEDSEFKEILKEWRNRMDPWLPEGENTILKAIENSNIREDDKFISLRHINDNQFESLKNGAKFLLDKIKDDCIELYSKYSKEKIEGFSTLEPSKKTEIFETYCGNNHTSCYEACKLVCKKNNIYFNVKEMDSNEPFLSDSAHLLSTVIEEEFVNKRPEQWRRRENEINSQNHSQIPQMEASNSGHFLEQEERRREQRNRQTSNTPPR